MAYVEDQGTRNTPCTYAIHKMDRMHIWRHAHKGVDVLCTSHTTHEDTKERWPHPIPKLEVDMVMRDVPMAHTSNWKRKRMGERTIRQDTTPMHEHMEHLKAHPPIVYMIDGMRAPVLRDLRPRPRPRPMLCSAVCATAFAESAAAYERNMDVSGRGCCAIAVELGASKEHPVHEMEFFNVGGAKVSIIVIVNATWYREV